MPGSVCGCRAAPSLGPGPRHQLAQVVRPSPASRRDPSSCLPGATPRQACPGLPFYSLFQHSQGTSSTHAVQLGQPSWGGWFSWSKTSSLRETTSTAGATGTTALSPALAPFTSAATLLQASVRTRLVAVNVAAPSGCGSHTRTLHVMGCNEGSTDWPARAKGEDSSQHVSQAPRWLRCPLHLPLHLQPLHTDHSAVANPAGGALHSSRQDDPLARHARIS